MKNLEDIKNNARLAAIVESSDDAIYAKTLDGIVTDWNKSAEKMYGYTANEIIGKHISLIVPQPKKHEVNEILEKIREGKHIDHFETQRIAKDGTLIDVSISASPIKGDEGDIFGAAVIARDITKIHKMEMQIKETEGIKKMFEKMIEKELEAEELKKEVQKLKTQLASNKSQI